MALRERLTPVAVRDEPRLAPPVAEKALPPVAALPDEAVLRRSSDPKVVAGVCVGLGRYLDVDPWVLRGLVVLLSLGQGTGVLFYLTAWLIIPQAKPVAVSASQPSASRSGRVLLVAAAVLFAIEVSVGLPGSWEVTQSLWPCFVVAFGVAILLRGRRWPRGTSGSSPPATARLSFGAGLVLFGLLWLADTAGLVGVPWPTALPVVLAISAVAAFDAAGRSWWPGLARIALAIALAVSAVVVTAVPYAGGVGDRLVRPPRFGPLASQDEMGVGVLTLDLRHLPESDLPADVTAGVGVGWLVVRLPIGVAVQVDGRVASGEIELDGRSQAGLGLQQQMVVAGPPHAPRLTLHLSAGVGAVIVPSPGR